MRGRASPKQTLAVVADEPDNRTIECAVEAGSEYIITEDKALLRVKGIRRSEAGEGCGFSGARRGARAVRWIALALLPIT